MSMIMICGNSASKQYKLDLFETLYNNMLLSSYRPADWSGSSYTSGNPSVSKTTSVVTITANKTKYVSSIFMNEPIDVTDYDYLYVEIDYTHVDYSSCYCGLTSAICDAFEWPARNGVNTTIQSVRQLNISSLSGYYYFFVAMYNGQPNTTSPVYRIRKIWLEKSK